MKRDFTKRLAVVAILVVINMTGTVCAETVDTRIGKLDFELGVPTKETVAKLYDEMDFQRACQLYLWALPAVSFAQMRVMAEFASGAVEGDVVISEGYRSVSVILTAQRHDALHQRRALISPRPGPWSLMCPPGSSPGRPWICGSDPSLISG